MEAVLAFLGGTRAGGGWARPTGNVISFFFLFRGMKGQAARSYVFPFSFFTPFFCLVGYGEKGIWAPYQDRLCRSGIGCGHVEKAAVAFRQRQAAAIALQVAYSGL